MQRGKQQNYMKEFGARAGEGWRLKGPPRSHHRSATATIILLAVMHQPGWMRVIGKSGWFNALICISPYPIANQIGRFGSITRGAAAIFPSAPQTTRSRAQEL